MITTRSIAATLGRLALMGTMAGAHLTTVAAAEPEDVSPGWSAGERDWFRSFSQGSQLLPYEWFRALELPDAPILFRADGLARYGYIPRPADISNPDGLPVGFAIDRDRAGVWVGMSCAACHTGKVEVNGRALLIDGAPGNGDLSGLIDGLAASMRATLADPAKQARFIDRVTPRSRR